MPNPNAAYWRERFSQLEAAQNRLGQDMLQEIEKQYRAAERELEGQISRWYMRLADNNGISMAEARRLLAADELAEFKWDVWEYIRRGEENTLDGRWLKQLENASAKFHISRLEALKIHTRQSMEELFARQQGTLEKGLGGIYRSGYYHTAYELQKGFGIGWDIAEIDQAQLSKVLAKPWAADGRNFSERIWGNKTVLINELHTELSRSIMLGERPQKAIEAIVKKLKTSRSNAGRLVMTESAYFSSAAQGDCYNELGVEEYQIVATLDDRTSDICQEMDLKVFPMKDYQAGVTAPPFHVRCRSTTVPYFDDDFGVISERAARGADGKTYYVPADMSYADWKESFAAGGDKSGLQTVGKGSKRHSKQESIKLSPNMYPEPFRKKSELQNTQTLVDFINKLDGADPNVIALYGSMGNLETVLSQGLPFTISHASGYKVATSYYRNSGNLAEVKLVIPKLSGKNLTGQIITTLHEEMHLLDLYCRQDLSKPGMISSANKQMAAIFKSPKTDIPKVFDELFEAFDKECDRIRTELVTKLNATIQEYTDQYYARTISAAEYKKLRNAAIKETEAAIDYQCRNAMGGGINSLQDIYDALSAGTAREAGLVKYGHGASYYREVSKRCEETLANYGALSVVRPDLVAQLQTEEPELVKALEDLIQEMLRKGGA